jgi:hypothetical protein
METLEVEENNFYFSILENLVKEEPETSEKINLAKLALHFAVFNHTGRFSSKIIENELLNIARAQNIALPAQFAPLTTLHVFTQCYPKGGHTKVAGRWIKFSSDTEKHSVILLDQNALPVPEWLNRAVEDKKGELISLDNALSDLEKALILRKTASQFEKIVLHVHMFDVIHLLAFGTEEFKRPVLFFNHADHCFWSGVSIADMVLSFRGGALELCKKKRGVKNNRLLPLPLEQPVSYQKLTRKDLQIEKKQKVILSIGESYKFKPIDGYDFVETMLEIVMKHKNTVVIVIGPSLDEPYWENAYRKSGNKIKAIGPVYDKNIFYSYIDIADLYIQSFPLSSITSFFDVILQNKTNVLSSLCTCTLFPVEFSGFRHLDTYTEINLISGDNIAEKAELFLSGKKIFKSAREYFRKIFGRGQKTDGKAIFTEKNGLLREQLQEECFREGWLKSLAAIFREIPLSHSINGDWDIDENIDFYDINLAKIMKMNEVCFDFNLLNPLSLKNSQRITEEVVNRKWKLTV